MIFLFVFPKCPKILGKVQVDNMEDLFKTLFLIQIFDQALFFRIDQDKFFNILRISAEHMPVLFA